MLRSILKIKLRDLVKITKIREKTGESDIGFTIKKLKLRYVGHLVRGGKEKWNYLETLWTLYEMKRKGVDQVQDGKTKYQ